MPNPFTTHINEALANPVLQDALDGNAERRINGRVQALATLADPQAMRQEAHAVRAKVITHLDEYLEQFEDRASANGMKIHHAADAAEAVRIVLEIAKQNDVKLIAKSKTMLSEEIHLNPALEEAGLKVVETDLGEFIVQLRGEHPSHIITPAVHLRRQECGETFHEKLGIPLTDDIPTMTAAARAELRQVFLTAEMGISGVNFGVAETGAICLVTNEGNGRMVTTLPRIHIALMGIERLVPSMDDLALMLSLLPRSATGQKMSVYTSLIHSPRRPGEADGPEERHIILIDNGRSLIRRSPLAEALYCIRCGACLNACPVFREIGGHAYVSAQGEASTYPGPIGSVLSPALFGSEFGNLARASSLCGACKEACPVDIDLPKLLLRVRAGLSVQPSEATKASDTSKHTPWYLRWGLAFFTRIAVSPGLFHLAQRAAGLGSRLVAPSTPWIRLPAITRWGYSKDFPRPAMRPFREQWKNHHKDTKETKKSLIETQRNQELHQTDNLTPIHPDSLSPLLPGSPALLSDRFGEELVALGGAFTRCERSEAGKQIVAFLRGRFIKKVLAWEEGYLPEGLLGELESAGIQVCHEPDPNLFAGLTGALAAVANSGTLALPGGPGHMQSASLLPPLHIAILKEEDIVDNLAKVLNLREVKEASSVALVSGPSRTADIEMTLTIGVHGPGEVQVFCISD
jgi:L-lactate dehydrogenase complex protein LldF